MEKLEWLGYPMVKKFRSLSLFVLAQLTNVTDGRTDVHRMLTYTALMHMHRAVKMLRSAVEQARGNIYEGRGEGRRGAANVMPKVERVVSRRGCPQPTKDLESGDRRELPQRDHGPKTRRNEFGIFYTCQEAAGSKYSADFIGFFYLSTLFYVF